MERVKIIRCINCKYRPIDRLGNGWGFELEFPEEYKCPLQCDDPWYSRMPDDDWYCANGEEK